MHNLAIGIQDDDEPCFVHPPYKWVNIPLIWDWLVPFDAVNPIISANHK